MDRFILHQNVGDDAIQDFQRRIDRICLRSVVDTIADISTTQVEADVQGGLEGATAALAHPDDDDLTVADFFFGRP
ncbi:MAG: hypothetical protein AAGF90_01850 [Pseudomonadota bacterium]